MRTFTGFAKIRNSTISDDVVIATTNYGGRAGRWTVGLQSEATHGGNRIAGTPSSKSWRQSRGRNYYPSEKCLAEMIEHAIRISNQKESR